MAVSVEEAALGPGSTVVEEAARGRLETTRPQRVRRAGASFSWWRLETGVAALLDVRVVR